MKAINVVDLVRIRKLLVEYYMTVPRKSKTEARIWEEINLLNQILLEYNVKIEVQQPEK